MSTPHAWLKLRPLSGASRYLHCCPPAIHSTVPCRVLQKCAIRPSDTKQMRIRYKTSTKQIQSRYKTSTKQTQSRHKRSIVHDQGMGNVYSDELHVYISWHMNSVLLLRLRPCTASSHSITPHTGVSALFIDNLLGMHKSLLQRPSHGLCPCHISMKSLQYASHQQT